MGRPSDYSQDTAAPSAQSKLADFGIAAICEAILAPSSMASIAERIGVSQGSLISWIAADPERSARAREARIQTAQMWDEKATRGIEDAADQFELAKAKELAHHYRWRASKIAPRDYGDKVTQEHTGDAFGALLAAVNGTALKVVADDT
jgi:hypothetical protein